MALGGGLGYLMASSIYKDNKESAETLPEFDPKVSVYIGKAYKVPEDIQGLQKLYTKMVGKQWGNNKPKWLNWLLETL